MKTLAELVTRFCELVDGDQMAKFIKLPPTLPEYQANLNEAHTLLRDMEQQAKRDRAFEEHANKDW